LEWIRCLASKKSDHERATEAQRHREDTDGEKKNRRKRIQGFTGIAGFNPPEILLIL
jgi:hypothetical protein